MSEDEFNSRLKKIQEKNLTKERKEKLKEEKLKYKPKSKLPSTSKLILLGSVLLCLEIIIFCEYMMYKFADTGSMYTLIGISATMIPIIWGYYSKSKAENTVGGIVYEIAMQNKYNNENINDNEDMSDEEAKG